MNKGIPSFRPTLTGNTHAVSTGHYLATAAGYRILEQGVFVNMTLNEGRANQRVVE